MYVRMMAQTTYCKDPNDVMKFGLVMVLKSSVFQTSLRFDPSFPESLALRLDS